MNPRIYLLALGTFTVGTEGYVIAGVLPSVAHDMHTSIALCGQMVTIFALSYALAGPPLIGLFRNVPAKRLLIGAALAFAVANVLAAIAPDFAVLAIARILAALGAALFAAPAAAAAAALSDSKNLSRAISITAGGNALALTLGAPIGTLIGEAFGWRMSFGFVVFLSVVTAIAIRIGLPEVPAPMVSTAGRFNLLKQPPVRWGLLTTLGLFPAAYSVYTYLSPIVFQATGLGSNGVAALMIVFGAGGIVGGRLIGRVLVQHELATVLRGVLLLMAALLTVLTVLTFINLPLVAAAIIFPLMFVIGATWWSGGVSQQTRLARLAPTQRSQALGLQFSAQFLGVSVGGALGGLALSSAGPVAVPVVGVALALVTIITVRQTTPEASETGLSAAA